MMRPLFCLIERESWCTAYLLQWETAGLLESIWEVCTWGLQTCRGVSSPPSSVEAWLLFRRDCCWLISTQWNAYYIKSFPDWLIYRNKGMTLAGCLAKVCLLRWVDEDWLNRFKIGSYGYLLLWLQNNPSFPSLWGFFFIPRSWWMFMFHSSFIA